MPRRATALSGLLLAAIAGVFLGGEALAQTAGPYATNYIWDADRRLVMEIAPDPDGAGPLPRPAVRYSYDSDGRLIQTDQGRATTPNGSDFVALQTETATYDAAGQAIKLVTPAGVTQTSYDGAGRTVCIAQRMNPAIYQSLPADACALGTAGPDGPDRIAKTSYDLAGQVTTVVQGLGTAQQRTYATFSYSANGLQTKVVDARGNPSQMEYDGLDRLVKLRLPPTTVGAPDASTTDYEAYSYDAGDNRLTKRLRDGQIIESCYDALNRETRRYKRDVASCTTAGLADDVFIVYDLRSKVLSTRFQSAAGQGVVATYDKAGRQLSESSFGRTLLFQYDKASNRTRITWPQQPGGSPAFFVAYVYDADSRPTQVRQNNAVSGIGLLAVYGYDELGRRTSLTRGNGATTSYGYDAASRLTGLGQDLGGTAADQTFSFVYSPASQILSRTTSNTAYNWPRPADGITANSYTGLNQDAALAGLGPCGTAGAGYDCRGNLTTDGTRTFAYDIDNRLTTVTEGGSTTLALTYDPLGRLRQTTAGSSVTQYLYDGPNLLAEYDGTTGLIVRRYVHGPGTDEPLAAQPGISTTTPTFVHQDWLGSVIAESDAAGVAGQVYSYGPWGEPNSWSGSRFRYTGQIALPEARLYYYKARVYDPASGRFLQTDPVGQKDDLNLYAYTKGDPLSHTDPMGTVCNAIGATLICDPPGDNTAPFSLPLGRGSPTYIGPAAAGYHVYNADVSQSSSTSARLEQGAIAAVVRDPVPNSGDRPATPGGTENQALPLPPWLFPSDVLSYVTTDTKGNTVVVNVTIGGEHALHPGYVAQYIIRDGETVSIVVVGEGNANIQANPPGTISGSAAFQNKINGDMREAVLREARKDTNE